MGIAAAQGLSPFAAAESKAPVPVTVGTFIRAETDLYFQNTVKEGAFGKLRHNRTMTSIDQQNVVRMNRDTLYSSGVFDLNAATLTVTLPDNGRRFMSIKLFPKITMRSESCTHPADSRTPRTPSALATCMSLCVLSPTPKVPPI